MKHITLLELMELQKQGKAPIELFFEGHKYESLDDIDYYCYDYKYSDDRFCLSSAYINKYSIFGNSDLIGISSFILDSEEKEYLDKFIKPFKKDIKYIVKYEFIDHEYITVAYENKFTKNVISLPPFKTGSMYKDMEVNKEYSIEELGL